jgi:hypothetical protein
MATYASKHERHIAIHCGALELSKMVNQLFSARRKDILLSAFFLFLLAAVACVFVMILAKPTLSDLYPAYLPKNQEGINFVKLYPKDIEGCSTTLGKMLAGDHVVRLGYWKFVRQDDNKLPILDHGEVGRGAQRVYSADRLGLSVTVSIITGDEGVIMILLQ